MIWMKAKESQHFCPANLSMLKVSETKNESAFKGFLRDVQYSK